MAKIPIFDHVESRYQFLTMRKVINGQKYYRNTQNLKKFDFFAKKIFLINLRTLAKMHKFENTFTQKRFEQYR